MKKKASAKNSKGTKRKATKKKTAVKKSFFWKDKWLPGLILFLLPFALYGISISYGYVLDDKLVLSENNFVKAGFAGIADIFTNEAFTGFLGEQQDLVVGSRYRPLSMVLFAIEYELFGANPGLHHFLNILFYAFTGLLIFRLFAFFFDPRKEKTWFLGLAFLTALLFIAHPVHTEVVANIKGRDEIIALLLSLGCLYYSFRYAQNGKIIPLILSGICFFLGLLAKENTLTFLAVVPLSLYLFSKANTKQLIISLVPLLIGFVVYLFVRVGVIGYLFSNDVEITGIMNNPFYGTTLAEKYATIMYTLGIYLKLLIIPHPLTHDYYPYQIPIINWVDWRALLSLALYLGLAVLAVRAFRKRSVTSWSIIFYVATLSIVSNIVFPVGAPMNERFLYMPSLGYTFLLAWLLVHKVPVWIKGKPGQYLAWGLLGLTIFGYCVKTITRVPAWENEMTLNRAAIKVSTNSARANSYMAYSLYRYGLEVTDLVEKKRVFDEATPYVDRALEIYPEYSDALTCKSGLLAGYYQMDNDLDKLLDGFYRVLTARHVSFITTYLEYLNPRADTRKMVDFYYRSGFELMSRQQKNYPLAIQFLNYGLGLESNNLQLLRGLAATYYAAGQYNNAIQSAQRGLQIDPADQELRALLQQASRSQ